MTVGDVLACWRRAWAVVLVGVLLTGLGVQRVRAGGELYAGEATVVLYQPGVPTTLQQAAPPAGYVPQPCLTPATPAACTPFDGLVMTAGLVARRVADRPVAATASDGVSLVGEGVRSGWTVTLVSRGGQWVADYDDPELRVQSSGRSAQEATALLRQAQTRIARELGTMQQELGVAPSTGIQVRPTSVVPDVRRVQGSPLRALAATLLLGLGGTTSLAVWTAGPRRRRQREPAGPQLADGRRIYGLP